MSNQPHNTSYFLKMDLGCSNDIQSALPRTLMVNLFSSGAPHIHFFHSSATILLVWSANGDGPFQGKFQSEFTKWRYLPMELCDVILRTNRVRCALNMINSMRKVFLERAVIDLVYNFKYNSNSFTQWLVYSLIMTKLRFLFIETAKFQETPWIIPLRFLWIIL